MQKISKITISLLKVYIIKEKRLLKCEKNKKKPCLFLGSGFRC